jgi:hypothetical protein
VPSSLFFLLLDANVDKEGDDEDDDNGNDNKLAEDNVFSFRVEVLVVVVAAVVVVGVAAIAVSTFVSRVVSVFVSSPSASCFLAGKFVVDLDFGLFLFAEHIVFSFRVVVLVLAGAGLGMAATAVSTLGSSVVSMLVSS